MVKVHAIATDGLPDMDNLTGRVAFIFDGCIVSGWPLGPAEADGDEDEGVSWEADSDVGYLWPFYSVTHWIEFPRPLHEIEKDEP